jgi:DNA-binding CsgD family transcriptional regulator
MLAARRGNADSARKVLADAQDHRIDPFHQVLLDSASAEVYLALGDWAQAVVTAESGWASSQAISPLWSGRFAMRSIIAAVEQALDAQAQRQSFDLPALISRLRERLDAVDSAFSNGVVATDNAAHLAHAAAYFTRIQEPDPDAWARAARSWESMSDRWATATARLREAEAAVATGATARAAAALQDAQQSASQLDARPLLDEIAAVARRSRLSLERPTPAVLQKASIDQLGLTSREAEVLTHVAVGRTNRQLGEALFISEKTASVHVSNIMRKLGVTSRVDAAAIAQRLGVA